MRFNDTIISLTTLSSYETAIEIAKNVKKRRLELNLTQEVLSQRSGVKLPTYRKFERTGEISLKGLLKIAMALDTLEEFRRLFSERKYESLEDVINESKPLRKRAKIKKCVN